MEKPPSTGRTAPVTYSASGAVRKAQAAATSSGSGGRPAGMASRNRSSPTKPGATTLTVIPCGASSAAATCASVWRKAPAVATRAAPGTGRSAEAEETKTIRPGSPLSTRRRAASRAARNAFVMPATAVSHSSCFSSRNRPVAGSPDPDYDRVARHPIGDRGGDVLRKSYDDGHQNFPTTKPPSTRRNAPVT